MAFGISSHAPRYCTFWWVSRHVQLLTSLQRVSHPTVWRMHIPSQASSTHIHHLLILLSPALFPVPHGNQSHKLPQSFRPLIFLLPFSHPLQHNKRLFVALLLRPVAMLPLLVSCVTSEPTSAASEATSIAATSASTSTALIKLRPGRRVKRGQRPAIPPSSFLGTGVEGEAVDGAELGVEKRVPDHEMLESRIGLEGREVEGGSAVAILRPGAVFARLDWLL